MSKLIQKSRPFQFITKKDAKQYAKSVRKRGNRAEVRKSNKSSIDFGFNYDVIIGQKNRRGKK